MSNSFDIKPANDCQNNQTVQIKPSPSSATQPDTQAQAYSKGDTNPLINAKGGNNSYKQYYEIIFINKSYIIHSHHETDAIHIFLKNKIYKRDHILQIKKVETMKNSKKNIILKDKNYSLYIVRGFKENVFEKI
jgi:hypothetical protein